MKSCAAWSRGLAQAKRRGRLNWATEKKNLWLQENCNTPLEPGPWSPSQPLKIEDHCFSIERISGWWFQHIWKILVKMGSSSPNRGENRKYLKPPPSYDIPLNTDWFMTGSLHWFFIITIYLGLYHPQSHTQPRFFSLLNWIFCWDTTRMSDLDSLQSILGEIKGGRKKTTSTSKQKTLNANVIGKMVVALGWTLHNQPYIHLI